MVPKGPAKAQVKSSILMFFKGLFLISAGLYLEIETARFLHPYHIFLDIDKFNIRSYDPP
jgi:hypothetical protein